MKVPTVRPYEFPPLTYLVFDEGQENDVLMETYRIKEIEEEVVIDPGDGGERKIKETRYQIQRKTFVDLDLEPLKTREEAIRKATSEMILEWANRTPAT